MFGSGFMSLPSSMPGGWKPPVPMAPGGVPMPSAIAGGGKPMGVNPYGTGLDGLKGAMAAGVPLSPETFGQYMPDYASIMDGGKLKEGFQYNPYTIGDYGAKKGGLDTYKQLKGFATGTGPGEYYKNASNLIDQSTAGNLDSIRSDTARGVASGMSNLAATGGLDSGSRERLAQSGTLARLNAGQNVYRDATMAKGNAAMTESGMRLNALGQVTGMDVDRMKTNVGIQNQGQAMNLGNMINDVRGGNLYAMEGWGKLGDIYGSKVAADAALAEMGRENPGLLGMGGFLGTGLGGRGGLLGTGLMRSDKDGGYVFW